MVCWGRRTVCSRYTNWLFITIFLSSQLTRTSPQRYCLITVPTELLQFFVTIRGLHQKPLRSPWWTCSLRYFGSGWWGVTKSKEPCLLWLFTLHPLGCAGRWPVLGLFWKKVHTNDTWKYDSSYSWSRHWISGIHCPVSIPSWKAKFNVGSLKYC